MPLVHYKFWRKKNTDIQQRNRLFGSNQTLAANVSLVLFRNVMRYLCICKIAKSKLFLIFYLSNCTVYTLYRYTMIWYRSPEQCNSTVYTLYRYTMIWYRSPEQCNWLNKFWLLKTKVFLRPCLRYWPKILL